MVCRRGGLSGLCRGFITFGGLVLQGHPDGYLVRNIFEGSFAEELMVAVNDIFEGGFKFPSSEARKKFDRTASADRGAIGERFLSDWGSIDQSK